MNKSVEHIPMAKWGKDHWSLLGYVDVRCVDYKGVLCNDHMRTDINKHPLLMSPRVASVYAGSKEKYPTRLKNNEVQHDHDDWDCLDDMEAFGLVEIISLINGFVTLTRLGSELAGLVRAHKAAGGSFATFDVPAKYLTELPQRKPLIV